MAVGEQQLVEQALAVLAAAQDAAGHSSRALAAQLQDQARVRPVAWPTPFSVALLQPLTRLPLTPAHSSRRATLAPRPAWRCPCQPAGGRWRRGCLG